MNNELVEDFDGKEESQPSARERARQSAQAKREKENNLIRTGELKIKLWEMPSGITAENDTEFEVNVFASQPHLTDPPEESDECNIAILGSWLASPEANPENARAILQSPHFEEGSENEPAAILRYFAQQTQFLLWKFIFSSQNPIMDHTICTAFCDKVVEGVSEKFQEKYADTEPPVANIIERQVISTMNRTLEAWRKLGLVQNSTYQ